MDFVTPILTPIVESLLVPIKTHLGFLFSSSKKIKIMHEKVTELEGIAEDMRTQRISNIENRRMVPNRVPDWLAAVEEISASKETIPTGGLGCFHLKTRYKAGKRSSDIVECVDRLMTEISKMVWTNERIPLGAVSPSRPSTSHAIHEQHENQEKWKLESRYLMFNNVLKSLDPNINNTQKLALCGMGGVGKTTMMVDLRNAAKDKKLFDYIVEVVVGQNPNLYSIQQTIAEYLGEDLNDTTNNTRAVCLQRRFENIWKEGKKKILVILDDIWEKFNLSDIGLASPSPIGVKLLLTSRNKDVCTQMGVETSSLFQIEVLKDLEEQKLFWETVGLVSDSDIGPDLQQIGEDILKKCGGLPIAITTIACTLKDKNIHAWRDALYRLEKKSFQDLDTKAIFEISYNYLKEEDLKDIFILSGLYPEDYYINMEELLRYGWGLKFYKESHTIATARDRVHTCVDKLIDLNLLIKSDREGCVKMHDLVRDFVLSNSLKVKQASDQLRDKELYERILLRCTGMFEFPEDFKHPNLALLKLLGRDELPRLNFAEDFYKRMEKLEVLSYTGMHGLLLPQYLTNLRTLRLHRCPSVHDISCLGDLIALEVLSLAYCDIRKLPSEIGKLVRLKLLDLTGCVDLCIDDGVFQSLKNLEELYLGVRAVSTIRFTDTNCDELKMLSGKLSALELEFFNNKAKPINVNFENLERFKISIGRELAKVHYEWGYSDQYSFKNTLNLVATSKELLECKINKLFRKTELLQLQSNDISCIEDILTHPPQNPFRNLKALRIFRCAGLAYLFTISVAKTLTVLENLEISSCPVLKSVVYGENSEAGLMIMFPKLKILSLDDLPQLLSFCDPVNQIELPQLIELKLVELPNFESIFPRNCINVSAKQLVFNNEVMIPKLEKLSVYSMNNLKEIWAAHVITSNISSIRVIIVGECPSLENLFPSNPTRFLCHLEELTVENCGSIEVLFNIDLGEIEHLNNKSSLRIIKVKNCLSLREVWRIRNTNESNYSGLIIGGFEAVEHHSITKNKRFKNIVTPAGTTANFDLRTLKDIQIKDRVEQFSQVDTIVSSAAGGMQKLQRLTIGCCSSLMEVFETKELNNDKTGASSSSAGVGIRRPNIGTIHKLPNLKVLHISQCDSLEYIFTYSILASLKNLEELEIRSCKEMKEIARKEIQEHSVASCEDVVFHRLKSITLEDLPKLAGFFLEKNVNFLWPLLEYVKINHCPQIMVFTYGESTTPTLRYIHTELGKHNLGRGINFYVTPMLHDQAPSPNLDGISSHHTVLATLLSCYNLIECNSHKHDNKIFASEELQQLQELERIHAINFHNVEEVFEVASEVTNNESPTVVKIPKLREVDLHSLPQLRYIWKHNRCRILEFPNLTRLSIKWCDILEHVFTYSMVGCVMQLQELNIIGCKNMKEIVKEEEDSDDNVSEIKFPYLKSLKLEKLSSLEGFCLGNVDFTFPSLDTLVIKKCPTIMVFTKGHSTTPEQIVIKTNFRSVYVGEDINSFIMIKKQQGFSFEGSESYPFCTEDDL